MNAGPLYETMRRLARYGAAKFDVDHANEGRLDAFNWTMGAREMTNVVALIEGTREAIGYEVDLRLMWLEEPVPSEKIDSLVQVRDSTSTVICRGENYYTRFDFIELIQKKAVDVIMPDLAKAGGIMEGKRIAEMADAHYIPIAPHNVSSHLGMMAVGQVLA